VRFDHVRPGFQVRFMDAADDVGARENEHLVAPFVRLPAEIRGGEGLLLDHRSHRAVHDDDFALQKLFKRRSLHAASLPSAVRLLTGFRQTAPRMHKVYQIYRNKGRLKAKTRPGRSVAFRTGFPPAFRAYAFPESGGRSNSSRKLPI